MQSTVLRRQLLRQHHLIILSRFAAAGAALFQSGGGSRMHLTRGFRCQRAVKPRKEVAKEESRRGGGAGGGRGKLFLAAESYGRSFVSATAAGAAARTR